MIILAKKSMSPITICTGPNPPLPQWILTSPLECIYSSIKKSYLLFVRTACGTVPADIVFLLDASGSVGTTNFQKQKDFVAKFANSFDIGPRNVQIGVTTFSTAPHNQFNMNKYPAKANLVHAIQNMPYQSGGTHTDTAINYITANSFKAAAGDRPNVANILIVMTDGQSQNKPATIAAAAKLHQQNIKVSCVVFHNTRKRLRVHTFNLRGGLWFFGEKNSVGIWLKNKFLFLKWAVKIFC